MIGSFCVAVFLFGLACFTYFPLQDDKYNHGRLPQISLSFSNSPDVVCPLTDVQTTYPRYNLKAPSLLSFLRASTAEGNQDLTFSGLVVVSKMANVCHPLVDVRQARVQVNKIALITMKKECSLCELAAKAQHAGYSMVIVYFSQRLTERNCSVKTAAKLLIPVVYSDNCQNFSYALYDLYTLFSTVDQTDIHVRVLFMSYDLKKMAMYLRNLHFWFLLGPIITMVWLRRKKILCRVTTARQIDEESSDEEIVEEGRGHSIQPDLIFTNHAETSSITVRVARIFGRSIRYLAIGFGYVILTLAALPVGISSGGLSFFRFDEQERIRQKTFWDVLLPENTTTVKGDNFYYTKTTATGASIAAVVNLWWSVVRVFWFFMYSAFACKRTWTVSTNPSKLIRSDWFSSNMYLLVLCFVVPYCSLNQNSLFVRFYIGKFLYFMLYNVTCTVCNFLFIIILNKHRVVTRYVFYISVSMICAYAESDIVAVFYFILNSQGSLNNLKLTALRTVALGLTLNLSFSSSMHIIRKLMKPQESVFEGLSER